MHNIVISAAILAVSCTWAARLDNTYLPGKGGAGSGANFVNTPYQGATGTGVGGTGAGGTAPGPIIPIISYQNSPNQGDGTYSYSYESGNGIMMQESGQQSSATGPEGPGTAAQGSYSYIGPDGNTYTVTYTADENGFQPQGAHLPTPPPIPAEILQSLQQQGVAVSGNYVAGGSGGGYTPSGGSGPGFDHSSGYHYRK